MEKVGSGWVLGPTAFEQPGSEDLGATKHSDNYACP
jgi:hypothetical protein